jgi:acyl-CoA-binding protein
MDLNKSFLQAVDRVRELDTRPSNENLLKLYGLFKQATEGDVKGERPGGFDFKAIAKYDSWSSQRGMSRDEAMQTYIDLVNALAE